MALTTLFPLLLATLASAAPTAAGDGPKTCKQITLSAMNWIAMGFHYRSQVIFSTPSHQIDAGNVEFTLTNTAIDYVMQCAAASSQPIDFFYGDQWFDCTGPAGSKAAFQYDKAGGKLSVKQDWSCQDDPSDVQFHGEGTVVFSLNCTVTDWKNPDWTQGELYSTEMTDCSPLDLVIEPQTLTGVA
ncbi:hypothetical protein OQA88_1743 [Cercophora sp. LCS_1]